ncbi:type I restriction enzyme, R subunit [Proteiniborus ethanoligenes]|uniref:Type I restriction enzyme, R subunit n=1 Tax=Proteiniborus ethanoligenes TaxID=415015 RepID=A0A1H3JT96_9FIRM|nr:hypothetical protein [Proteiniborus ethanoligenes]SDY43121.1 type I restriction enzyme, R subunit [Proteiniborus ethanoligenes]
MFQSNFQFLEQRWPMLADLGKLAEKNIYQDSNTSLIKLGMFAELMVGKQIQRYSDIPMVQGHKRIRT